MELQSKSQKNSITFESTSKNNHELSEKDRFKAIKLFDSSYVGKYGINYFYKNTDKKHDKIIAEVDTKAKNYILGIIKSLNMRPGNKFTFVYKDGYLFANTKESTYSLYGSNDFDTRHLKSGSGDKELMHDIYGNEKDSIGEFYLKDLSKIPTFEHYVKDLSMEPKMAAIALESIIAENPFMSMLLVNESDFKDPNEYNNILLETFINSMILTKGDFDLCAEALELSMSNYLWNIDPVFYTTEAVTKDRGIIDKARYKVTQVLSPIAKKFMDQYDSLVGEKAANEEVITGSKLLKARRLFLSLILAYKTPAIVAALLPFGGPVALLIKIAVWLGSRAKMVTHTKNLASTVTGLGKGNDDRHDDSKRQVLNELDLELKICREKIDDAKSKGDNKAKYDLMRLENKIEKEIFRIKYDKHPDVSFVGK